MLGLYFRYSCFGVAAAISRIFPDFDDFWICSSDFWEHFLMEEIYFLFIF
jgi:hypothetical protein